MVNVFCSGPKFITIPNTMKKTKNPPPNDIYKMIHFRDASGENNEHGLILFISSGPALTLRNVLGSICREKKKKMVS